MMDSPDAKYLTIEQLFDRQVFGIRRIHHLLPFG
jgi:hypothetical protein